jgi:hypothetical protein
MEINKEELDGLKTDIQIAKIQALDIDDALDGNLTNRNMASFRNTYTICAQDSLDATFPMYVHFNVIDETIKIVSVKVSFWIDQFRAYATTTVTSGSLTAKDGGVVSGAATGAGSCVDAMEYAEFDSDGDIIGFTITPGPTAFSATKNTHTHVGGVHTHDIDGHDHDITYGIYEDNTEPTISFSISEDGGIAYSDPYSGFVVDQLAFDITTNVTSVGHKILKFTTDLKTRLSVQVEIKVDIKTR